MPRARSGIADDNVFEAIEKPKKRRGRQEDGTYVTSGGKILPARNRTRREAYEEPTEYQVEGKEILVQNQDGSTSFLAQRMSLEEYRKAGYPERKRQKCYYRTVEVYAGAPRPHYSYDEIKQIQQGELKR